VEREKEEANFMEAIEEKIKTEYKEKSQGLIEFGDYMNIVINTSLEFQKKALEWRGKGKEDENPKRDSGNIIKI